MTNRFLVALLFCCAGSQMAPSIAVAQIAFIAPTAPSGDSSDRIANTQWVTTAIAAGGLPALPAGNIWIGSAGNVATAQTPTGDWTISAAGLATLAAVNSNTGSFGSATQCVTVTNNAKGLTTGVSATACTPPVSSITGLGAGVATALGNALNGTGGLVAYSGNLGAPTAGTIGTGVSVSGTAINSGTVAGTYMAAVNLAGTGNGGITGTAGYANGGTNATTQTAAINNMHPTPTRAGDVLYWNGTAWTTLAGNNSGTQFLQETSSGVPSWVTVSGTGTVTSVTCFGTAITSSGTCVTAGQMPGEPSNGNASAGNVGEFVSASIVPGSAVSLTNGTAANVTSISLTAGDWDVNGTVNTSPAGSTTTSYAGGAINTVSAIWPGLGGTGTGAAGASGWSSGINTVAGNPAPSAVVPTTRLSLSATTTVYLVAISTFATSTNAAYGFIRARRVR